MKPRNTVVSVGRELAEIKIYTLRSRGGYRSFQCCWYELGKRQTKTFGHLRAAKLFAQQKIGDIVIRDDAEAGQVVIKFPSDHTPELRKRIRSAGFCTKDPRWAFRLWKISGGVNGAR